MKEGLVMKCSHLLLLCVVATARVRKDASCCPTNETRRALHVIEHPVERAYQNEPVGRRKQAEECPCDADHGTSSALDTALTVVISFFVLVFLVTIIGRSFKHKPPERPSSELVAIQAKLDAAKVGLVPVDDVAPDATCPVCLDVLTGDVVRPPNCSHVFHKACITQWVDSALAAKHRQRKLLCPICARPLTVADDAADEDDVDIVVVVDDHIQQED